MEKHAFSSNDTPVPIVATMIARRSLEEFRAEADEEEEVTSEASGDRMIPMPRTSIRVHVFTRIISCVGLSLLLAGCVTPERADEGFIPRPDTGVTFRISCKEIELARPHTLYVGRDGEFIDYQGDKCRDGEPVKIAEHLKTMRTSLDDFARNCTKSRCELVLFVHGGLNSFNTTAARMSMMREEMLEEGYYPIFIAWRSSFWTTYSDHLFRIRQGRATSWARVTSPFYLLSDLARVVANAPVAWAGELRHSLETTVRRSAEQGAVNVEDPTTDLEKFNIRFEGNDENYSANLRKVGWIVTAPAKLLVTPFAYTLGRSPWTVMTRRTLSMLYSQKMLETGGVAPKLFRRGMLRRPPAATSLLNDVVAKFLGCETDVGATLIGHSMGVMVTNDFLESPEKIEWDRVVHMASADSVANFYLKLVPYLKDNPNTKYYGLFLHPENENREVGFAGFVPSGSLLVWVDNMYTSPATLVDRTAGRLENFYPVFKQLNDNVHPNIRKRIRMKVFGKHLNGGNCPDYGVSERCIPQQHGDFTNAEFWTKAFYDW